MASAAEQLAASMNFGAFAKATELKKRLWFTLFALIVYRFGAHLPLPGVDPSALAHLFDAGNGGGGIFGMFDMLAGGSFRRVSIFALNIMPYISASIIIQLMTAVVPKLEALKKEGESGRKTINQYTRLLTVLFALFQSYGLSVGLRGEMTDGVLMFTISVMATLTAGTMFLMWLGEQITARGIGNGISLIIFAGIVAELPRGFVQAFELGRTGSLNTFLLLALIAGAIGVIAFVVYMERAQRRVLVQYPKRQVGNRVFGGEASHLPLKLNTSGVIPPIFASSLLLLPLTAVSFMGQQESPPAWVSWISTNLAHGTPLFMFFYGALIIAFCFIYTAIVFNPAETAENLRKQGGFVPGYRPGENTANYLDYVLTRITVVGSLYLAFVCMLPEVLISQMALPFYFGGTSLLIVVSVTMDTIAQVNSHLIAHQYEGLIKKARLRGASR